jgi:hypothetical protein
MDGFLCEIGPKAKFRVGPDTLHFASGFSTRSTTASLQRDDGDEAVRLLT